MLRGQNQTHRVNPFTFAIKRSELCLGPNCKVVRFFGKQMATRRSSDVSGVADYALAVVRPYACSVTSATASRRNRCL